MWAQPCLTFVTLWTVALQFPLSMGFPSKNEWVAIFSSRSSSWPRDWTCISFISLHWQTDPLPLIHLEGPVLSEMTSEGWAERGWVERGGRFLTEAGESRQVQGAVRQRVWTAERKGRGSLLARNLLRILTLSQRNEKSLEGFKQGVTWLIWHETRERFGPNPY